ncbi:MAG: OadG family protein [Clostridia bacterium]|nr:OadG family protein [Clostridia bacterium]MBP3648446.1 OadG family protein [Clostridia bacterium]
MMKWFMALVESVEPVAEVVEETAAVANSALVDLPLFTKGLLTTAMGLLGVFLVLTLFFLTIKLMQKIGAKESSQE